MISGVKSRYDFADQIWGGAISPLSSCSPTVEASGSNPDQCRFESGRQTRRTTAGPHSASIRSYVTHTGCSSCAAFIALDRAGCNRLIKALRRARDGAYGRDE